MYSQPCLGLIQVPCMYVRMYCCTEYRQQQAVYAVHGIPTTSQHVNSLDCRVIARHDVGDAANKVGRDGKYRVGYALYGTPQQASIHLIGV